MEGFGGYTDDEIARQQRAAKAYAKASAEASAERAAVVQKAFPNTLDAIRSIPETVREASTVGGAPQVAGTAVRGLSTGLSALASDVGRTAMDNVIGPAVQAATGFGRGLIGAAPGAEMPSVVPAAIAAPGAQQEPSRLWSGKIGAPTGSVPAAPGVPKPPAASVAPAAPAPQPGAGTIAGTASMGGQTKSYTPEQLSALAGPDTQARYKGPGEIYANELAINTAHDAYRRGTLTPKDYIAFLSGQATQAAQLNDPAANSRNRMAQLELQAKQETESLYKQVLASRDPAEQKRLLGVLFARLGKTKNDRAIKLAGRKTKDVMGNETQEAEIAIDPDTGERYTGGDTGTSAISALAGGGGKRVVPASVVQQAMKESGLSEQAVRAYLQQNGITVGS